MNIKIKEDNFNYYLNKRTVDEIAIKLIVHGGEIFKRAKIISDFNILKDEFNKLKNEKTDNDFYKIIEPIIFDSLIDRIRICIFFENYMKSVLISKGYLIHKIIHNEEFKELFDKQRKEPVLVNELHNFVSFDFDKEANYAYHKGLSSETISFKTMLTKTKYKDIIGLPISVLNTLVEMKKYRNQLHLVEDWRLSLSETILNKIQELISFVDDIAHKMNKG